MITMKRSSDVSSPLSKSVTTAKQPRASMLSVYRRSRLHRDILTSRPNIPQITFGPWEGLNLVRRSQSRIRACLVRRLHVVITATPLTTPLFKNGLFVSVWIDRFKCPNRTLYLVTAPSLQPSSSHRRRPPTGLPATGRPPLGPSPILLPKWSTKPECHKRRNGTDFSHSS